MAQKLHQLIALGSQITRDSSLESFNTVYTIPENFSLSDSEKSVLSKGLVFVAPCISKKLDEFSVKQDVEKFPRRRISRLHEFFFLLTTYARIFFVR